MNWYKCFSVFPTYELVSAEFLIFPAQNSLVSDLASLQRFKLEVIKVNNNCNAVEVLIEAEPRVIIRPFLNGRFDAGFDHKRRKKYEKRRS